ncbi:MAG: HAMP domain-containing protein [Anaerolineae bacterium]|nr:HAMP domain-containing protein [Anaerolineae bacterium]
MHITVKSLRHRWRTRSLSRKLLLPIAGLMLVSLLASTLAFVAGTTLTQRQLVQQQMDGEVERITATLNSRTNTLVDVAAMLTHDPDVAAALERNDETGLRTLNERAVVVRERFRVDLIQIFDDVGRSRTNLVLSALYRESSLLDVVQPGTPALHAVGGRLLLLSRADLPGGPEYPSGGGGTVIAGIDLETELGRLSSGYRLLSELAVSAEGVQVTAGGPLYPRGGPLYLRGGGAPLDTRNGLRHGQYARHVPLDLGRTPADLLLVRSTGDVARVTTTGLFVMVGSTFFTTLLLMALATLVARSIALPVEHLAAAAQAVAEGDLGQEVHMHNPPLKLHFGIGRGDEIGLLSTSFNCMVAQLRSLYQKLETKVYELASANQELGAANERLLELDQLKSKFVSDVSHELRTPLTSVKGYGDLVFRGRAGPTTELQRRFLGIMLENTNRLTALIDNLLSISRIDSAHATNDVRPLNMNAIVAQVVDAHHPQAQAAGLTLAWEHNGRLPAVLGDHNQMIQVATNLVSNALNYTPAGEVHVRTCFDPAAEQVCIEVQDTGVGIAPDDLPHIFERFYRSEDARNSAVRGTGLGLAIVHEIVTLHGGQVEVESAVGRGSTFRVRLPAAKSEAAALTENVGVSDRPAPRDGKQSHNVKTILEVVT